MDVAALVVSVVALVLAGMSALYARRQARAADETAAIERARRHDERTPVLDVDVKPLNHDALRRYQQLVVRLTSAEPLTGIDVEIHDAPGLSLSPNQEGVAPGALAPILTASRRTAGAELLVGPGGTVTWQLEVDTSVGRRPARTRLIFHVMRGDESWVVQHEARVPPGPPRITTASMQRS